MIASQKSISLSESLERLALNRDFQAVILSGYLNDEAVSLVHQKAHPMFQSPNDQLRVDQGITSIGVLKNYLDDLHNRAELARKELDAQSQMRDELLQEGQ